MTGAAILTLCAMLLTAASVLHHSASERADTARVRVAKARVATWTGVGALITLFIALGMMG